MTWSPASESKSTVTLLSVSAPRVQGVSRFGARRQAALTPGGLHSTLGSDRCGQAWPLLGWCGVTCAC